MSPWLKTNCCFRSEYTGTAKYPSNDVDQIKTVSIDFLLYAETFCKVKGYTTYISFWEQEYMISYMRL
jgi:hypothetical protein